MKRPIRWLASCVVTVVLLLGTAAGAQIRPVPCDLCGKGSLCVGKCTLLGGERCPLARSACQESSGACISDGTTRLEGTCCYPPKADRTACDDGQFCNGRDLCRLGVCEHSGDPCAGGVECANTCNETTKTCFAPPETPCTQDRLACTDDHCDGAGSCVHTNNTIACDDGVFCNGPDHCSGGSCSTHDGDPCLAGAECANVCSERARNCRVPAGEACTGDGGQCADFRCDGTGRCQGTPKTGDCDDGKQCTTLDVCVAGSCVGQSICQAGGDPCAGPGTCNAETGRCDAAQLGEGDPCDDGDRCIVNERCVGGRCRGEPRVCAAIDECHAAGQCSPLTGECTTPPQPEGHACTVDGKRSVCDGQGTCRGVSCGNGIVEAPAEDCERGECCNPPGSPGECRFKSSGVQCGTETRACHRQFQCNGQQATCPTTEQNFSDEGITCSPDDCVVATCRAGSCETGARVCSVEVTAPKKSTPDPRIKVTCLSDEKGDCSVTLRVEPPAGSAAEVAAQAADCAGLPQTAADVTGRRTVQKKVLQRKKASAGLRFRTVLTLRLNDTGKRLLRCRALSVTPLVTVSRGGRQLRPIVRLVQLLQASGR